MNEVERARWSLITLHQLPGVGWHTIDKCYRVGWRPGRPFTAEMLQQLRTLRVPEQVVQRIGEHDHVAAFARVKERLEREGVRALTICDEDYPLPLKEIAQPPWVLYMRGRRELLQKPMLAVIGSRRPTPYGQKVTRQLVTDLATAGYVIVSGMAYGIDTTAHIAAIQAGGETIAVLGSGINVIYPKSNRRLYETIADEGLVLSEMPLDIPPAAGLFPQRNRVISGLSCGCVVIEAGERSGTLITADYALEEGREVFAVPGPIDAAQSQGTLKLIQQGAKCVRSAADILEEFSASAPVTPDILQEEKQPLPPLEPVEQRILQQLNSQPMALDELYVAVQDACSFAAFQQAVLTLEMKGLISQLPGMRLMAK